VAALDHRYAQALLDVAESAKLDVAEIAAELRDFSAMFAESAALRVVLGNPSVERGRKLQIVDALVARAQSSRIIRNFLAVLADRGRIGALPAIARAFDELWLESQGLLRAAVTSARPLETEERNDLERRLGELSGRRIVAEYHHDSKLIGGFVARVGDTVYDGSIRGRLERLRAELLS
jgi:F-type H+-transporting ATPase subunit delta